MALTVPAVGVGDDVLASYAAALKAAIDDLYTTTVDTTIATAGAGWTINAGMFARTALGGKLITIHVYCQRAAALTVTAGNLTPDETMCTIDAAYRPSETLNMAIGTGAETGEATLSTGGIVSLRSLSDSASAAANYRGTVTFLTA